MDGISLVLKNIFIKVLNNPDENNIRKINQIDYAFLLIIGNNINYVAIY